MGHSGSQKGWEADGRLETARIQDSWVDLGLPLSWVERFSKLQLKSPTKRAEEGVLSFSHNRALIISGASPPLRCSLLLLQGCPDLPGGFLVNMHLTVSCSSGYGVGTLQCGRARPGFPIC